MSPDILWLIAKATAQTLHMVAVAAFLGSLFGVPLGVFLATSGRGELLAAPAANRVLGAIVNATRSTPFIILVVAIIPFTRLVAGTSIGTSAAIVPLTVATVPFVARLVEAAIREAGPMPGLFAFPDACLVPPRRRDVANRLRPGRHAAL